MFRYIQHYAHAINLRASLFCELRHAARAGKAIPEKIMRRVLKCPHGYDDKILLLRLLDPSSDNLLIDVGGNTGYWSESFLEFFPNSWVVAFEPQKREFEEYRQRFSGVPNVVAHNVGLSDEEGWADIHIAQCSAHSSLHEYAADQPALQNCTEGTEKVRLVTLDSYRLGALEVARKFLKIDVQGHEMSVLQGATETLHHIDVVLVECSFLSEYENVVPSFAHVASLLRDFDIYPAMFRNHGTALGPHAWERDVIFCKRSLLNNVWGW